MFVNDIVDEALVKEFYSLVIAKRGTGLVGTHLRGGVPQAFTSSAFTVA